MSKLINGQNSFNEKFEERLMIDTTSNWYTEYSLLKGED